MMAYHWLSSSGTFIGWDGRRSPLLVELPPGGSVTVIWEIHTPAESGSYRLQFQPLIGSEGWVTGDLLTLQVTIHQNPSASCRWSRRFGNMTTPPIM
jgi:hypothetical protein